MFVWRYMIFGLTESDYEGGYYVGTLSFPAEYPLKPPSIMMHTPNGRF
jgi:ubiquitin-protein ligase